MTYKELLFSLSNTKKEFLNSKVLLYDRSEGEYYSLERVTLDQENKLVFEFSLDYPED